MLNITVYISPVVAYVGIYEAAECSSGTKSRMPLNNVKGHKLDLAHDGCLRRVEAVSL